MSTQTETFLEQQVAELDDQIAELEHDLDALKQKREYAQELLDAARKAGNKIRATACTNLSQADPWKRSSRRIGATAKQEGKEQKVAGDEDQHKTLPYLKYLVEHNFTSEEHKADHRTM